MEPRLCIFEFAYIARPDSRLYGREVHETRCRMGELLALQAPAEADMVMGVPESGVPAAEGFARASGIPYGQGLVKNRYIGRSFIAPDQRARADAVRRKLNPLTDAIAGKRLVVVDDSIVRGTTQRSVIRMLREAGAAEVHLRISSPPWRWPCFYGIDTPSHEELLATDHTVEDMARILGADSLAYITIENLKAAIGADGGFCDACFTGAYPTPVPPTSVTLRAARAGGGHGPPGRAPRGLTIVGEGGATYAGAGVDIAAGDAAVERLRSLVAGIGGFGGQFPLDVARYRAPVLVASTDGVGTKMVIARDTGRYDTVGIDLVAMCVDDLVCVGAEPLFMLDYIAAGKVDPDQVATVVAGVHEGCRQAGCALIGGETAEHAGVMPSNELDLAGFAVGVVEQGTQLGPERVREGDAVVGLASPGLRSNGYTLARHVLFERAGLELGDPAWAGADHSVADELLRPSVIYTPAVLAVRDALGDALHACAHITGGGIVGNLPRVLPGDLGALLDRSAWEEPRIFTEIERLGSVAGDEMDRVFNRGVGMALVVDGASGGEALAALAARRPCGLGSAGPPRSSARSSAGARGCASGERAGHVGPPACPPAGALGQDGGLHAQVGAQEQLVHRLQADRLPARGHAARGRRRALGAPRRGDGHRRADHGRRPRRLRDRRRGRDAGPPAEGLQRAQGGEGPRGRGPHRRRARPRRPGRRHRGHRDARHLVARSGPRGARRRGRGRAPGGGGRPRRHRGGHGGGGGPSLPRHPDRARPRVPLRGGLREPGLGLSARSVRGVGVRRRRWGSPAMRCHGGAPAAPP